MHDGLQDGGTVPGAAGTALLVEDDPLVRKVVARMLHSLGWRVLEAAGGGQALDLAGVFPGEIALLVTDVVMPGMRGQEVARLFRLARPGVEVLLISGGERGLAPGEPIDEDLAFLMKPFSLAELARSVQALLDGRRSTSRSACLAER